MPKILITGSKGQVGNEFQVIANNQTEFEFIFADIADLDITELAAVHAFFKEHKIQYCVNCAAYTAVDKAESNQGLAEKVNVEGAKNLALACNKQAIPLIHLSTDYVYHNAQSTPFTEEDATNPQSVYAQTKLDGDLAALEHNPQTIILRTSWVYSSFGNNFVKTMLRLGADRDELRVIFDQIGTPTYARDIAKCIVQLIDQIENQLIPLGKLSGVYHYSNEGVSSWYDFAKAIFDIRNIDCKVLPIETKDYPTAAKRPHFSVLNKSKIKETFGIEIPHWRESLEACLKLLTKNSTLKTKNY